MSEKSKPKRPRTGVQSVYRQRVREVRMLLAFLEGEFRAWRDDAEISAATIPSASEYHKGRARGIFEALDLVEKLDVAARRGSGLVSNQTICLRGQGGMDHA